jgi:hypothetical protein
MNKSRLKWILAAIEFVMLFVLVSLMFGACSKTHKDAALQAAVDELTRLESYTKTGLTYSEYSERVLTAKANIDVALKQTRDSAAKAKIEEAVNEYVHCRDFWKQSIDVETLTGRSTEDSSTPSCLEYAGTLSQTAAEYALGDKDHRRLMDKTEEGLIKYQIEKQY